MKNLVETPEKIYSKQLETPKVRRIQKLLNALFWTTIIVSFLIFILSYSFIRVPVSGPSMQPGINGQWTSAQPHKQDVAYISRFASYDRGDIIVIKLDENLFVIKRLIGIEGDRISIEYSPQTEQVELFLNGEILVEDYIASRAGMYSTLNNFNELKVESPHFFEGSELVVPEGHVFYLGDNRGASQDGAKYGPVDRLEVVGKVSLVIPYGQNIIEYIWKQFIGIFN